MIHLHKIPNDTGPICTGSHALQTKHKNDDFSAKQTAVSYLFIALGDLYAGDGSLVLLQHLLDGGASLPSHLPHSHLPLPPTAHQTPVGGCAGQRSHALREQGEGM